MRQLFVRKGFTRNRKEEAYKAPYFLSVTTTASLYDSPRALSLLSRDTGGSQSWKEALSTGITTLLPKQPAVQLLVPGKTILNQVFALWGQTAVCCIFWATPRGDTEPEPPLEQASVHVSDAWSSHLGISKAWLA